MFVAGVILHGSSCLVTTIAEVLIEGVDTLDMCAVAAEKDNIIMIFADLVHASSLLPIR
jgi:hypothetical protein